MTYRSIARSCQHLAIASAASLLALATGSAQTGVNVLTWHYDNFRSGQNTNETILTPANVNTNTFGRLFTYPVDGQVYAEPLYVSGVTIPGQGVHNIVFVATQHDSIYAFDADSNTGTNGGLLWQVSLGTSAVTPNGDFGRRYGGYSDIYPEVGITSTPVIDPVTGTIYVDALSHEGTSYIHRIHALNITNGMELPFSPVPVTASMPGVGEDNVNGVVTFNSEQELQRTALTLAGGKLYVATAGYADTDPYHGWVIGFNAANLVQLTNYVFNTTPNGTIAEFGINSGEGGIWMSGSGLAVDAQTNLYGVSGNGNFNANQPGGTEYGDSAFRLSTTNGLAVADYFTPYNQATLAANDLDFGSGGPVLLPDSVGSAAHPHLLVTSGKGETIYLLDRDNLGKYNTNSDSQIVQSLIQAIGGTWSSAVYFNQHVYFAPADDLIKSLVISNAQLSGLTSSRSGYGWPGANLSVSANGINDAILWAIETDGSVQEESAILHAYDAYDLTDELYNSSQAGIRDLPNAAVKFTVPTVANGKVYVGTAGQLAVYGNGLFLTMPAISPAGGIFTNSVPVTMTDTSPGATIRYSLDSSSPGPNSPIYTGPLVITNTVFIKAAAFQNGYVPSLAVGALFIDSASTNFANGFARREFYPGALRTDIENPAYPGIPSFIDYLTAFETPSGQGNTYAERISGYFVPPVTTNYVFFLCSDDDSDLFLSTNGSPTGKQIIAQETGWSNPLEWLDSVGGTISASKRSDQFAATTWPGGNTIHLTAGTPYYIEGDHHQATGGDNFAVTYKFAGDPDPTNGAPPALAGPVIGVIAYNNTYITIASQPQDSIVVQNSTVSLSVSATSGSLENNSDVPLAFTSQWQSAPSGSLDFTNVPGATSTNYTTPPLTVGQNGARFRACLTTAGFTTNTDFATLTVIPDTHTPVPVAVTSVSANGSTIVIQFSEPLDPATAQMAANYEIIPGNISGVQAVLDGTGSNLTLAVSSPLPPQVNLTLKVNGVENLTGNAVLPGTALKFSFVLSTPPLISNFLAIPADLSFTSINTGDGQVILQWTGAGTLQTTTNLAGPWIDTTNQGSPQILPRAGSTFFRLRE